jgi:hypothetical protein
MVRVISQRLPVHVATSVAAFATLVLPAFAAAAPPPTSAVSQYIEMLPTSGGGQAVGVTPPGAKAAPLTPKAATSLDRLQTHSRQQAERLKAVATAPEYGAPQVRLVRPLRIEPQPQAQIPAAIGALTSAGGPVLPLLGTAMLATVIAAVAAALRRTRAGFTRGERLV